jgi:stage II sporulation protein D
MRWARSLAVVLALAAGVSAPASAEVRVAVLGLFHSSRFVVETAPGSALLVDSGRQQLVAGADARQRITVNREGRKIAVEAQGAKIVGERFTFGARPGGESDFVLAVPGKIRRHYRGRLIVTVGEGELLAVVEMELETAVASVVAAESPGGALLEALKAQAVVSRSYLLKGGQRHRYADFCDTTHCQFLREPPPPGSSAALAARATKGEVLTWRGQPFAAMYSASCGGHTHSLAQVGGQAGAQAGAQSGGQAGGSAGDYPYFAVECAYCRRSPERWSSRLSKADAATLPPGGEQARIRAGRRLGWKAVPGNTFTRSETADAVVLHGVGRGHGIGLCQRGAYGMARDGKNYRAILAYYFPNTNVESSPAR